MLLCCYVVMLFIMLCYMFIAMVYCYGLLCVLSLVFIYLGDTQECYSMCYIITV